MARLLWFLSMALAAVVLGSTSAIYATQTIRPTGMLKVGVWEAVRSVGDAAADPYAHALIASSGQLPPGSAEGTRFVAQTSRDGEALIPDCSITLTGQVEVARLWTLSLAQTNGMPLPLGERNDLGERYSMHSRDLVYNADGSFALTIGPRPETPNTILLRYDQPISLVLHVYDGAVTSVPETGTAALPQVSLIRDQGSCS